MQKIIVPFQSFFNFTVMHTDMTLSSHKKVSAKENEKHQIDSIFVLQ